MEDLTELLTELHTGANTEIHTELSACIYFLAGRSTASHINLYTEKSTAVLISFSKFISAKSIFDRVPYRDPYGV